MVSKEQEEKIINETRQIVKVFLVTRASDIELASKMGLSSSTIGRRLTNKERILKAFPDKGEKIYSVITRLRKQNALKGKIIGAEASKMTYGSDEIKQKLNIKTLGSSEAKQYSILKHLIFTYRPKLSLLSELFQIEEKELYDTLVKYFWANKDIFKYIFELELTNQDVAKENIIAFYHDLVVAKKNKDEQLYEEVIRRIDDKKFQEGKENHKTGDIITDELIDLVIRYQIKYCIPQKDACKTFGISYSEYKIKLSKTIKEHELFWQYDQLSAFLQDRQLKAQKR